MNKFFRSILVFAIAAGHFGIAVGIAVAADDFIIRRNILTQEPLRLKMVDQGDGTFAQATSPGVSTSTGPYKAEGSGLGFTAPVTITKTGNAKSWLFTVEGGSAAFRVNGGDQIIATLAFPAFADDFVPLFENPSIDVEFLEPGATFQVIFGMAK